MVVDESQGRSASALVQALTASAEALIAALPPEDLRKARAGKSRAQIAERAGVTRQAVFYYETGKRRPHGLTALRYAEALGLVSA